MIINKIYERINEFMCCQRSHYNKLCPKYHVFPIWYSPELLDYYSLTDGWHGHWFEVREDGNCDPANLRLWEGCHSLNEGSILI